MFSSVHVYSKIVIHMLTDHGNVHYSMNPQRLPLNGNAHRQIVAKVLRWKASAHPSTTKKKKSVSQG